MTKQTWRAERFRSADVHRSTHQRTAEIARTTKALGTRNKPKEKKQTVNLNKASEQETPLWQKILLSFIGATLFSSIIFAIGFLIFSAHQIVAGSSRFPVIEFNIIIGATLVMWLIIFTVIWYCPE